MRIKLTIPTIAILMSIYGNAFGITIIDDFSTSDTPDGVSYNTELGYSGNSGNTDTKRVVVKGKAIFNDSDKFILGKINYNYGESSGAKNVDNYLSHLRLGLKVSDKYQEEIYIQYQKNSFSKLKYRYLMGAGGVVISSTGNIESRVGLGLFYENSKKNTVVLPTTRVNAYSYLKLGVSETASVRNVLYYQPSVSNFSDSKIMDSASIETKITDHSALKLSVVYQYDSRPAIGVKTTDISYSSGIVVSF